MYRHFTPRRTRSSRRLKTFLYMFSFVPFVSFVVKDVIRPSLNSPLPHHNGRIDVVHVGQAVGDALVAINAGLAFLQSHRVLVHGATTLGGEIHGIVVVAVAAFARIGLLHGAPDVLGQFQALGLEFLRRVDGAHHFVKQFIGRLDFAQWCSAHQPDVHHTFVERL